MQFLALLVGFLSLCSIAITQDCKLVVPANPLSAAGLATPYKLLPPCHQANATTSTFVQGAVIDLATGQISVYNPLVTDNGILPRIEPTIPTLPASHVVALWFGTNAGTLTLVDTSGSLVQGSCVNGIQGSIFGQFAYCNAPLFFAAANASIQAGKLRVPHLCWARDGERCPSVRDFSVVWYARKE